MLHSSPAMLSATAFSLACLLAAPALSARAEPVPAVIENAAAARDVPDSLLQNSSAPLARILGPAQDYANNCQGCHGAKGVSVAEFPALANRIGYFPRIPEGRDYLIQVPNVALSQLSSARLAELMNWMLQMYSAAQLPRSFEPYTAAEVDRLRISRIDPVAERERIIVLLIERDHLDAPETLALSPFRNY
ncbi:hypothetical protein RAS12_16875 [Achromobacter seleniivolatilans]|uniref:Cytochrome c domain-containing protein n=1 Tax=Achromobacter seleniivolatilans TaxID=3047478 RepID=A0ABY9LV82_9BURK|nr:hypothetical protein [Achromobacter sp. R39]WMD18315.1 hypothetical protein RAS12_16875 [Achromobacter sp. R39]